MSISAVSEAQNTPIANACLDRGLIVFHPAAALSLRAVGEYQAQHSTSGLSGGGLLARDGFVRRGAMTGSLNYHTLDQAGRLVTGGRWINKEILQRNTTIETHLTQLRG